MTKRVMILAGEVSGDIHAAALVRAMKLHSPALDCFGMGGAESRQAGVETVVDIADTAVMGFVEVIRRLPFFLKLMNRMLTLTRERKPDVIILVDYPGFNLRFAAKAHALGFRIVYYICPQVWAWNRSRMDRMAKTVDHLISIFPFEKAHFADTPLRVDTVGHPLVEEAAASLAEPAPELPWKGSPRIALLPGSRGHVLKRVLPILWQAAAVIEQTQSGAAFIVAAPDERTAREIEAVIRTLPHGPARWSIVHGRTRHVLKQARVGIIASGTATIEASLMECPMVIVYRMAELTYQISRRLIQIPHIGMVNIVAGKRLCPELIQHEASPAAIAAAAAPLLEDGPERTAVMEGLRAVNASLGSDGANQAATLILADLV